MIMKQLSSITVVLGAALLASGCASGSQEYPSLSTRNAERISGEMAAEASASAPSQAPLPADALARSAALLDRARTADQTFHAQLPASRSAAQAAAGQGPESNQWSLAQVALADLRAYRSEAAIALGDLDLIYADAALQFAQRDAIASARDEVAGMVVRQDRTLDLLFNLLSL